MQSDAIHIYHDLLTDQLAADSQAQLDAQQQRRHLSFGSRPLCTRLCGSASFLTLASISLPGNAGRHTSEGVSVYSRRGDDRPRLPRPVPAPRQRGRLYWQLDPRLPLPDADVAPRRVFRLRARVEIHRVQRRMPGGCGLQRRSRTRFLRAADHARVPETLPRRSSAVRSRCGPHAAGFISAALARHERGAYAHRHPRLAEKCRHSTSFCCSNKRFTSKVWNASSPTRVKWKLPRRQVRNGDYHITFIYKRVLISELIAERGGMDHPVVQALASWSSVALVKPVPLQDPVQKGEPRGVERRA